MCERKGRPKSPNSHGGYGILPAGQFGASEHDLTSVHILDTNPAVGALEASEALGQLSGVHGLVGLLAKDFDAIGHDGSPVKSWFGFELFA